jgi:hypothetical protein
MPRYVVQRTFPEGLHMPINAEGAANAGTIVDANLKHDVTWLHSYVTGDKTVTYCVYDAPSPEAIRKAAGDVDLPVDRITEVRVLDPYFYH